MWFLCYVLPQRQRGACLAREARYQAAFGEKGWVLAE